MCAFHSQTGRYEEEENFLPLPGFEFRIVQSYAVLSKYSMNPFTLAISSDIFVYLTSFLLCKKKIIGYNHEAPFF